jgi:hypothetical protein
VAGGVAGEQGRARGLLSAARQRLRRANTIKQQGHGRVEQERVALIVAALIGEEAIRHQLAGIAGGEVLQGDVLLRGRVGVGGRHIEAGGAVGEAIARDTELRKPGLEVGERGLVEAAGNEDMDAALVGAGIGEGEDGLGGGGLGGCGGHGGDVGSAAGLGAQVGFRERPRQWGQGEESEESEGRQKGTRRARGHRMILSVEGNMCGYDSVPACPGCASREAWNEAKC